MTHPYVRETYARSLPHIGEPFATPEWAGVVLARPTPCATRRDAMGPYPLTILSPQADLAGGLERMRAAGLTAVSLVAPGHVGPPPEALAKAFDVVRPYKPHFLHDRRLGPPAYGKHHRYEVRRALARVTAAEIDLAEHLPAWMALYDELAARHGFGALHAFPAIHHETLARLEGVRTFGAFVEDRLVSAHIFVVHEDHAVSHLAASNREGYATGAAYALNDLAISRLDDCAVIDFGGGAGAAEDPADGLVSFKRGFANAQATAYLCGKVLDPAAYAELSAGTGETDYFPAYRGTPRISPCDPSP